MSSSSAETEKIMKKGIITFPMIGNGMRDDDSGTATLQAVSQYTRS